MDDSEVESGFQGAKLLIRDLTCAISDFWRSALGAGSKDSVIINV